jgi:hypothetical protein
MWLECPRSLTDPPTCTHPRLVGEVEFDVWPPEYDVGVGPQPECIDQTCACELTSSEWSALEDQAVEYFNEGPSEP